MNDKPEGPGAGSSQMKTPAMQPDHALLHTSARDPTTLSIKDPSTVRPDINKHAKIAIARQSRTAQRYNRRVPRACESCRQRKTKCSGETPDCRQCRELSATCVYPVGWKEKCNRQVGLLFEKVQDYENMLRYLSGVVDMRTADQIKSLLDKYSVEVDGSSSNSHSTPKLRTPLATDEPTSLASVEALEAIDGDEESLNHGDYLDSLYLEASWTAQSMPFADHDHSSYGQNPLNHMASTANGLMANGMYYENDPTIQAFFPYTNHSPS